MGIYVITGGTTGIGHEAVELLRAAGHEVCNLDIRGGDIDVNLGSIESRRNAIAEVHKRYPDGIDGLICNAGVVANARISHADVISINYFGAKEMAEGCFDLLRKKKGSCVMTCSGSLAFYKKGRCDITDVINNNGDEMRIRALVETFDQKSINLYIVSKYALARWMKRTAPGWAREGVRINAVAPGSTATAMTKDMPKEAFEMFVLGIPMPLYYDEKKQEPADHPARVMQFLLSENAAAITGQVVFTDGGTDCLLRGESWL